MDKKKIHQIALEAINSIVVNDPLANSHRPFGEIPSMRVYLMDQGHSRLRLVLVDALKLDSMWANSVAYLHDHRYPEAKDRWFWPVPESDDRYGIFAPIVSSVEAKKVEMMNGRHRTKWMIEEGFRHIIVAMDEGVIGEAITLGVVIRLALPNEKISPFYVKCSDTLMSDQLMNPLRVKKFMKM